MTRSPDGVLNALTTPSALLSIDRKHQNLTVTENTTTIIRMVGTSFIIR